MLQRRDRIERLDEAIADSEQHVAEQVFRVMAAEARGEETAEALRLLRTFEGILVEYLRARDALQETQRLAGRAPVP